MTDAKVWMNGKELLAIVDGFEAYYEERKAEILALKSEASSLALKVNILDDKLCKVKYGRLYNWNNLSYDYDNFATVSEIKNQCTEFKRIVGLSDDGRILVDLHASVMIDAMKEWHKHIDNAISSARSLNEWLETQIDKLEKELEALSNVQSVEKPEEKEQAPEEKEYLSFRDQMLLMITGGVIVFIGLLIFCGVMK